jgi:mono/diheme cytochrome c family protein
VPLAHFHHLRIGAGELAAVRAIDTSARPGDWLVLLALHVTTKEIPDWVWATYWWHDRPEAGPFAAGRPATLAGPWRNYLLDISYSSDTPREADGAPNIAFNPYVEVFPAGTRSNCAACHQGAVWTPSGAPPFLPVRRGARAADDPLFRTGTRLDFMWSIATEAR